MAIEEAKQTKETFEGTARDEYAEQSTPEPPPAVAAQPLSGPGAPGRTPDEIRSDMERTRGELSPVGRPLRTRVTELTDWRGQLREHQDQIITGAAVLGFAVGALVARRLRRRS